jgi:hypothetical protein
MEFRLSAKFAAPCLTLLALLAGAVNQALAAGSLPNSQPFVCGGSDATAKLASQRGSQFFQLTTSKGGASSAGVEITGLTGATFASVGFSISGTADATSGPFVSLITPNGIFTVPVTSAKLIKANPATGSRQISFAKSLFNNTAEPTMIVIQLFPSADKANTTRMSQIHVNTANCKIITQTLSDCPTK